MIFDCALAANVPMEPIQQGPGSNMFATSSGCQKSLQAARTFKALLTTCQQFYTELARFPVFYRVNEFSFPSFSNLLEFLAALTPRRRATIRYLKVDATIHDWKGGITGLSDLRGHDQVVHVRTLLKQCDDLRELVVVTDLRFNVPTAWAIWRTFSHWPIVYPHPPLLAMPEVKLKGMMTIDPDDEMDLEDPRPGPTAFRNFHLFFRPQDMASFDRERLDMAQRRRIIMEEEKAKREAEKTQQEINQQDERAQDEAESDTKGSELSAKTPMDPALQKALLVSGVHFPGEERETLDRFSSSLGNISARTRSRCNNVNAMGVIEPPKKPRYDVEGMLVTHFAHIYVFDVRRNEDGEIECQVVDPQSDALDRVWESIYALMAKWWMCGLLKYYRRSLRVGRARSRRALQEKLAALEEMVPPLEVLRTTNNFAMTRLGTECDEKPFIAEFVKWGRLYETRLSEVRKKLGIETESSEANPQNPQSSQGD